MANKKLKNNLIIKYFNIKNFVKALLIKKKFGLSLNVSAKIFIHSLAN